MCPFCLASAAVIAGSATGSGGLTAFVVGAMLKRNKRKILRQNQPEEVNHGNDCSRGADSEDSLTR